MSLIIFGVCAMSPCVFQLRLQEFEAGDEGCAFLDILIPPYDPNDDRDCHYYSAKKEAGSDDIFELTEVDPPNPEVWDVTSARYGGPVPPQDRQEEDPTSPNQSS